MNGATLTQAEMTNLARTQARQLRVARRALLPDSPDLPIAPVIEQEYVDSVVGHRIHRDKVMSVRPSQHLQPLQMSRHFSLHKEQTNDVDTLKALITFAAADIAQGEDAIVLLGAEALPFLEKLYIKLDNPDELRAQEALIGKEQKEVEHPILKSVLEGRRKLQERGQYGDYYVIVSPSLYEEAYTNIKTPADAPISQIQPLLVDNGFLYSEALEGKRGVIFSLARGAIKLAVPVDTYVDCSLPNDDDGRGRFRVAEQFRLVIDDPDAREPLK
jgi:uncharacterized linocin/CFP29 family protein